MTLPIGARLDVVGVSVAFGATTVLEGVSLTLDAGEVAALLGPSGSGKSTLLRVIAGLVAPDRGRVLIDGADVSEVPTHRRGVGFVFQDEQLFDHLDVAGNIEFGLRMRGDAASQRAARVAELLELVGLSGFGSRRVTELSGGEAKRVALARSLAPAPRVLLLDEPLTGLDRELHDRLAVDLGTILKATATTSLLVTHDHDEAALVADRTVVIGELGAVAGVEAVAAEDLHELRRTVLRAGTPSDDVEFPGDHDPGTVHYAVRDAGGDIVGAATWLEHPSPDRPGVRALQLRGMAVAESQRGRHLGVALLRAGEQLARQRQIGVLWANARDTAMAFYTGQGYEMVGDGFITTDTKLPHHRIVRDLD